MIVVFLAIVVSLTMAQTLWSSRSSNPVIAAGENVILDADMVSTSEIQVLGTLTCGDVDLKITIPRMMIKGNGKFICGTATKRYVNKLTVTLTGPKGSDDVFQSKVIAANDQATLELHGALRPITWTQLGLLFSFIILFRFIKRIIGIFF